MADNLKHLREQVLSRCKGYCEKCGKVLQEGWALHHRKLRKHGGENSLSNLIALHHECHNLGSKSVHMRPKDSYESGHLVKSFDDPKVVPLTLAGGSRVILLDTGEYFYLERNGHGW